MMIRFFLFVLAILILFSLLGYTFFFWLKLHRQKKVEQELKQQAQQAQKERFLRIIDSIQLIARAMQTEQCGFSEGVLRLKPLLDVLGLKLANYPAMWALYEVVRDMPVLDERKQLKRNERMRLDLVREAKEAELAEKIKAECSQLLDDIEEFKKAI